METAINQGYIAINGKYPVDNIFLLIWLKANMDKVIEKANGSTFLEISKSNFREIKILLPSEDVFEGFTCQTLPIFEKIIDNAKEILNLEGLRDTLLPKLISGELEVNESLLEPTF